MRMLTRSLTIAACLAASSSLSAAASISVVSPDTTVTLGAVFSLRVVTDAFPNLKAYQLVITYDPTRLQCLGISAGDVLAE